jgi:hypothetical protein
MEHLNPHESPSEKEHRLIFQQTAPAPQPEGAEPAPDAPKSDAEAPPPAVEKADDAPEEGKKAAVKAGEESGKIKTDLKAKLEDLEGRLDPGDEMGEQEGIRAQIETLETTELEKDLYGNPDGYGGTVDTEEGLGSTAGDTAEGTTNPEVDPKKIGGEPKTNEKEPSVDDKEDKEDKEEPKTHADQLFGKLDDVSKEIENAETESDKMKAFIKAIAIIIEIIKKAMDGSLFDELEQKEDDDKGGEEEPNELAQAPEGTPEGQVQNELTSKQPKTAAETKQGLREIREDADNKIETNTERIASLEGERERFQDKGQDLSTQASQIEQRLIEIRGEEGQEDKAFVLEEELKSVRVMLITNEKLIEKVQSRIDDLKKENEDLKKKSEVASRMEADLAKTMDRLAPAIKQILDAMGLKQSDMEFGFNKQPTVIINGNNNNVNIGNLGTHNPETGNTEIGATEISKSTEVVVEKSFEVNSTSQSDKNIAH